MYSKTRNTLTALTAASLFVAAGWMFGHPIKVVAVRPAIDLSASIVNVGTRGEIGAGALNIRRASRMNLAMPYFSFSLQMPQRRND